MRNYLIVGAFSTSLDGALAGCQDEVQKHVNEGYAPIGGLTVFRDTEGREHAMQAVYKEPARVALVN